MAVLKGSKPSIKACTWLFIQCVTLWWTGDLSRWEMLKHLWDPKQDEEDRWMDWLENGCGHRVWKVKPLIHAAEKSVNKSLQTSKNRIFSRALVLTHGRESYDLAALSDIIRFHLISRAQSDDTHHNQKTEVSVALAAFKVTTRKVTKTS